MELLQTSASRVPFYSYQFVQTNLINVPLGKIKSIEKVRVEVPSWAEWQCLLENLQWIDSHIQCTSHCDWCFLPEHLLSVPLSLHPPYSPSKPTQTTSINYYYSILSCPKGSWKIHQNIYKQTKRSANNKFSSTAFPTHSLLVKFMQIPIKENVLLALLNKQINKTSELKEIIIPSFLFSCAFHQTAAGQKHDKNKRNFNIQWLWISKITSN